MEQYVVVTLIIVLILLSFIMALAIFAEYMNEMTWIHLLLLPQLFGVMWALFKLKKLSS